MRAIQATEARTRLADLLRTVEHGKTVAITRHGRTIVHVVPARAGEGADRKQAVARFRRRDEWHPVRPARRSSVALLPYLTVMCVGESHSVSKP